MTGSAELGRLLALRRVRGGHVVLVGHDLLIDRERRVPDHIAVHVRELLADGHLCFGRHRVEWHQRPVRVTVSGTRLLVELEAHHAALASAGCNEMPPSGATDR